MRSMSAATVTCDSADLSLMCFSIATPTGRTYVLRASSKAELMKWFRSCEAVSATRAATAAVPAARESVVDVSEVDGSVMEATASTVSISAVGAEAKTELADAVVRTTACGFSVHTAQSDGGALFGWWPGTHVTEIEEASGGGERSIQLQAASRRDSAKRLLIKMVVGDAHERFLTAVRSQSGSQSSATGACTDRKVVMAMATKGPAYRSGSLKEGVMEKLGEGGARGMLGMKKWQERGFSLNEVWLTWHAKAAKSPTGLFDEVRGTILVSAIQNVEPSKVKGRQHVSRSL